MSTGANQALKAPYAYAANQHVQTRVKALATLLGDGLPCSVQEVLIGAVVVKFEVSSIFNLPPVTVPLEQSQYGRPPIQVGDIGRVTPTGVSVSKVAGLSSATPNLELDGNLATLVYAPLSSKNHPNVSTPSAGKYYIIYGAENGGVVLQDSSGGNTVVTIDGSHVKIQVPSGKQVQITAGGTLHPVSTTAGPSTVLQADA